MADWEQIAERVPGDAMVLAREYWEGVTEAEYAYGDFLVELLDEMVTERFATLRAICKQIGADYDQSYEMQHICRSWTKELREEYPLEKSEYRALIQDNKPMIALAKRAIENHWGTREIYAAKRKRTKEGAIKRYRKAVKHMRIGYPDLPEELKSYGLAAIEAAEEVCDE